MTNTGNNLKPLNIRISNIIHFNKKDLHYVTIQSKIKLCETQANLGLLCHCLFCSTCDHTPLCTHVR